VSAIPAPVEQPHGQRRIRLHPARLTGRVGLHFEIPVTTNQRRGRGRTDLATARQSESHSGNKVTNSACRTQCSRSAPSAARPGAHELRRSSRLRANIGALSVTGSSRMSARADPRTAAIPASKAATPTSNAKGARRPDGTGVDIAARAAAGADGGLPRGTKGMTPPIPECVVGFMHPRKCKSRTIGGENRACPGQPLVSAEPERNFLPCRTKPPWTERIGISNLESGRRRPRASSFARRWSTFAKAATVRGHRNKQSR
jgi:hypothetical protein